MLNIIYIIGDGFKTFAKLPNVYTFREIKNILTNNDKTSLQNTICVIGQGINKEEQNILKQLSRDGMLGLVINACKRHASKENTHKHKEENIMVSDPVVVIPGKLYRSYLTTDDACAEMSDHLTGQHIQGVVLTEAARQLMLAVAEKYILGSEQRYKSYFILKSMHSQYMHFAFPVDIQIEHEILELKHGRANSCDVKSRTTFIQGNKAITIVDIDYRFQNKNILLLLENQLAQQTLLHTTEQHQINDYFDMAS